jgi:cytochrome c-type biogenesis protein CcmH
VKRLLACLVFVSGIGSFGAHASSEAANAEAKLDRRVHLFSKDVRCLVCQNESLADSRAELALDLRREIRKQMKAGKSDEEVVAFLTERYGDFVLYRPPLKPSTYPLWFGPFALLAGALAALCRSLIHRSAVPDETLSPKERARIARLLNLRHDQDAVR